MIILWSIPRLSLRSNLGLKLANAFGVLANAFGVFQRTPSAYFSERLRHISANAFGIFQRTPSAYFSERLRHISANAFGIFQRTPSAYSANAFGVFGERLRRNFKLMLYGMMRTTITIGVLEDAGKATAHRALLSRKVMDLA